MYNYVYKSPTEMEFKIDTIIILYHFKKVLFFFLFSYNVHMYVCIIITNIPSIIALPGLYLSLPLMTEPE